MKKIIFLLALVIAVSCLFVSCDEKPSEITPETNIKDAWTIPYQYDLSKYVDITKEDYIGVSYTARETEATDEEIYSQINALLDKHATYSNISDRAAKKGDIVNIDFLGSIGGVEFSGGAAKAQEIEIGAGGYIPGFEDGIIGHNIGETFTIDTTFPEDYGNEDLNGKVAQFEITLNSIKQKNLPELTDAFIEKNTESKTVMEYYAFLKDEITKSNESSVKVIQKNEAFATIMKNCKILKYPEKELNVYVNEFLYQYMVPAQNEGIPFEKYVTENLGVSMDEFNNYAQQYAKDKVAQEIVFFAIAYQVGAFDVLTKADYDNYLKNVSSEYLKTPEEFLQMYGEDAIWRSLVYDSVMDYVIENGKETAPKK